MIWHILIELKCVNVHIKCSLFGNEILLQLRQTIKTIAVYLDVITQRKETLEHVVIQQQTVNVGVKV